MGLMFNQMCEDEETIKRLRKENEILGNKLIIAKAALESYASCCDGCTCGDSWSHDVAEKVLKDLE